MKYSLNKDVATKLKRSTKALVLLFVLSSSCTEQKNIYWLEDKVSKETFIRAYRSAFFHNYLRHATKGEIVKILDSLNDWSYNGDGGNLPPKYLNHPDSMARLCIDRADRTVFNPGEKPKTFLIPELEEIARGNFLDSIAEVTYNDYENWYQKEKKKKIK